jgi:GAF domain-containing protein
MDDNSNRRSNYVGRLHDDTQRVLRELLNENEKLRQLAATTERENTTLQEQLKTLTAELDRHQQEKLFLRQQLSELERHSHRNSEQIAAIEQRSANLANLYVSSYQLHGTLDREAVLTTIKEIIINLIGSEELAVFELMDDDRLSLVTSFGLRDNGLQHLDSSHPIGRLAFSGDTYLASQSPRPADLPPLVACIPLKLDGRVTGAIVVFSLLAHKSELQELDFELFDLLGSHAATALYCTGLQARLAAGATV